MMRMFIEKQSNYLGGLSWAVGKLKQGHGNFILMALTKCPRMGFYLGIIMEFHDPKGQRYILMSIDVQRMMGSPGSCISAKS